MNIVLRILTAPFRVMKDVERRHQEAIDSLMDDITEAYRNGDDEKAFIIVGAGDCAALADRGMRL